MRCPWPFPIINTHDQAVFFTGIIIDLFRDLTYRPIPTHSTEERPVWTKTHQGSRREVELDPQVSPEEIMSREVELGCES